MAASLALLPALAAVAWFPGFVTQDGPAHLYNAHILAATVHGASSTLLDEFTVRWDPLPNWAGHLVLIALVETLPPRLADRGFTILTAAMLTLATVWLATRVDPRDARRRGLGVAVLAALLGLNVTWLLGFGSFLLGAALFPLTLGGWWAGRHAGWSPWRAMGLAGLVALGYLGHLVSLGLTVVGLLVLEGATPGASRGRRLTTMVGLAPLGPLGWLYLGLTRQGGGFAPEWKHLTPVGAPSSWVRQLTWVDPISLARKDYLPISGTVAAWHQAIAPVVWLGLALGLAIAATLRDGGGPRRDPERRGWWLLGGLLVIGGALGPDTLGASHGEYLQQRVVLLGLVALAAVVRFDARDALGRAAVVALGVAWALQTLVVWDYAAFSERTAGVVARAGPRVGTGRRIATRWTDIPTPFRANPLLHADCLLGVGTENVIWSDYETRFYYFPVRFRDDRPHPDALQFERLALSHGPREAADRLERWTRLLDAHAERIDVVVGWNDDPPLDAVTQRHFRPTGALGRLRVWARVDRSTPARPAPPPSTRTPTARAPDRTTS